MDIAQHLVLPALTLALFYMAVYARMTRAAMLEVAQMDFVKTARAKGVRPGRILRAHMLRNALLPVVTLAGIQAGGMIGGAVLTETVFAWPGHRPPDVRRAAAARLQPAAGHLPGDRRHGRAVQPDHRPGLHAGETPPILRTQRPGKAIELRVTNHARTTEIKNPFWRRFCATRVP
jgi:hypothetical protein